MGAQEGAMEQDEAGAAETAQDDPPGAPLAVHKALDSLFRWMVDREESIAQITLSDGQVRVDIILRIAELSGSSEANEQ